MNFLKRLFKSEKMKPKCKRELQLIIEDRIEREGPNCDLNDIDVTLVTDMSDLFNGSPFNGDISKWDTSRVIDMSRMFAFSRFRGDISEWDTSSVEYMDRIFAMSQFEGDVSKWDISNVKNIKAFNDCFPTLKIPNFKEKK